MRLAKTAQIEGDQPYERTLYVNECRVYAARTAEAIIELGKRLAVIREKEPRGTFVSICEDEIGIPHSTAYRAINAALKAEQYPQIDFSHVGKMGKVYALLEAPDEDLKKLEEQGVMAGYTVEELDRMSVKDMRDLIRQLKKETDKIVKAEVKNIEAEKKALIKENDELRGRLPDSPDAEWAEELMGAVDEAYGEFENTLRSIAFDERILEAPDVQAIVEGAIAKVSKRVKALDSQWARFTAE